MNRQDILNTLSANRDQLRTFGVQKLGLFGSYSRDTARPDSDLDFLVILQPKTLDNLLNLKFFLEDTFNRPIDLVLESTLRPELRPLVFAEVAYVEGL